MKANVICRGADKSLAFHISPTFILIILLSHKSLLFFMPNLNFVIVACLCNVYCTSEVKMAQNNRDFTAKECRVVVKCFFLKGNLAKKIYNDMSATLGDKRPSYSTVTNCVARFRTGHLSTEDVECCGRPTK
jgi:hypothetical protein